MAHPAYLLGFPSPLGLLALAGAGFLFYAFGKKRGKSEEDNGQRSSDKVIKGTMKTAYKAKLGVEKIWDEKKTRLSEMWTEAKDEAAE